MAEQIKTFFSQTLADACKTLVIAILIIVIGMWLVRVLVKALAKGKLFSKIELEARNYLKSAIGITLRIIVVITAITYLGVPMSSVVAVVGSAGLALGLALQGGLSNIAGGMIILFTRPFRTGDYVAIGDKEGVVSDIGVYYTTLVDYDNIKIIIPNGTVTNSVVTDFTALGKRRVVVDFSADYSADSEKVRQVLLGIAKTDKRVFPEPPACVVMTEHCDSAVKYRLIVWSDSAVYWDVKMDLLENGKRAFDKAGIPILFQQVDVHMK